MPTEQEIETIIGLWNQNKTYGEIANAVNGPKSTVQGWIQSLIKKDVIKPRTESVRTQTKKATEAKRTYDRARRLELNDRLFGQLEEFLTGRITPRDYKDLMVSYGILEDKRSNLDPAVSDNKGVAALDIYIEELKREASKDESKAEGQHSLEQQQA